MLTHKFQINDMVVLRECDCEGVEQPWGLEYHRFGDMSLKQSRALGKRYRVMIPNGTIGIVINVIDNADDVERHYVLLTMGRQLSVWSRFMNPIE